MPAIRSLNRLTKRFPKEYALEIANAYVNHYKTFFKRGGYYKGASFVAWKPRKSDKVKKHKRGARAGKVRQRISTTDGILVETGRLKRSITRKSYSPSKIVIQANTPYAKRHNQGLAGMPRRPFLTNDAIIRRKSAKLVKRLIKQSLRR